MSAVRKKVSLEELRRLMNKHKETIRGDTKKIDSPLAKYSADGTLTCVLCNTTVRSESVWTVHINCKLHKNNILLTKQKKTSSDLSAPNPRSEISYKRLNDDTLPDNPVPSKKIKGILKNAPPKASTDHLSLPSDDQKTSEKSPCLTLTAEPVVVVEDQNEIEGGTDSEMVTEAHPDLESKSESLPEGFFDDPKMDAKARNVEYKDPIQEEWERFQKEIKEVVTVSSQIIEEDHEEATAERQIEEIDEQIRNWNRVLELERKKEAVKLAERIKMEVDENLSSGEEDFDEFLDWRSKKSYK